MQGNTERRVAMPRHAVLATAVLAALSASAGADTVCTGTITAVPATLAASGTFCLDHNLLVLANRVSRLETGIDLGPFASSLFRDNITAGCVVPFHGGTDAGNNL